MQFNNYSLSKISRFLTLFLCLVLTFTIVSAPFVNASAVGTVAVGVAGAAGISVSWPVAIVAILVVAVGAVVVSNSDELVRTARSWYDESAVLRNWADLYNTADTTYGNTVIYVPAEVQTYLAKKSNGNYPNNKNYLWIPPTLLSLNTLSQSQLLVSEVGDKIDATNSILTQTQEEISGLKKVINDLSTTFSNAIYSVQTAVLEVKTSVLNVRDNIISTYTYLRDIMLPTLNTNIINTYTLLRSNFDNLNTNISSEFVLLRETLPTLNQNLINSYTQVRDEVAFKMGNIEVRLDNFINTYTQTLDELSVKLGNIVVRLDNILNTLETKLDSSLGGNGGGNITTDTTFQDNMNNANSQENALMNSTIVGKEKSTYIIGQGKDLLTKYKVAFLAVGATVTKFLDLPILNDLVVFSLALGIFALIVSLGNMLITRDNNSVKSKNSKYAKGG